MNEDTREFHPIPAKPTRLSHWYLLTGLVIGLILGLVYTWWINPVVYQSAQPANLHQTYKDAYRSAIAQVFAATGNFERAVLRLELLEDKDPIFTLGAQAQRALAEGKEDEAKALALLAAALQATAPQATALPATETQVENTPQQGAPIVIPTATLNLVPTQTLPVLTPIP